MSNGSDGTDLITCRDRFRLRPSSLGVIFPLALSGCSRAPSLNIVGSFFPSWMLCAAIGCGAATAVRLALGAVRLDRHVLAPPLAYCAVATAMGTFAWLFRFGQ